MPDPTVKQTIDELIYRCDLARTRNSGNPAAREYSLAITALEDAQMRWTRGRAIEEGQFHPSDLDVEP